MTLPNGRSVIVKENDYKKLQKRLFLFTRMKLLLEKLAPEECITEEHDYFSHSINCVFCKALFIEKLNGIVHESDCSWLETRKLLEELK